MTIEALARRDVVIIDENRSAQDAARAMRERHVGAVVVVRGEGRTMRLAGIVTDRDIAMAVAADGRRPDTAMGSLARQPIVTISSEASVADAGEIMNSAAVRRLVMVDAHRRMIGIVSLDDVLAAAAHLLQDLSTAISGRRERVAAEGAAAMPDHANHPALLLAPELAATWRQVVQP
jgi:CBS domain-containing protein